MSIYDLQVVVLEIVNKQNHLQLYRYNNFKSQ